MDRDTLLSEYREHVKKIERILNNTKIILDMSSVVSAEDLIRQALAKRQAKQQIVTHAPLMP